MEFKQNLDTPFIRSKLSDAPKMHHLFPRYFPISLLLRKKTRFQLE